MKLILLLVLIAFPPTLLQTDREESDLLVVKFSWAREQQKSRMIRGAQDPRGSISTPIQNDRDLGSRRADLQIMEKKAAGSADTPPANNYQLHLEVKNIGTSVVKSLVWEFRPTGGPDDYQPKQYLCGLQVKANEKKVLEVWTPYAPVKVISADGSKDALKDGKVIINQIEYQDGSIWKRHGWNFKLPADSLKKLSEGQCSVF